MALDNNEKNQKKKTSSKAKKEMCSSLTPAVEKYTLQAATVAIPELISILKKDLKVTTLKDLFIYYYDMNKNEIRNKRKNELINLFIEKLTNKQNQLLLA